MSRLAGKIIEAAATNEACNNHQNGHELRRLRLLSGLTHAQMACRLKIPQADISKIEKDGEARLYMLQQYVAALDASLRIDTVFSSDAPFKLNIQDIFGTTYGNDNQFTLALLEEEPIPTSRDVILSIKPQYSDKILEGRKTVELRRRFPVSVLRGTFAYIYATSPEQAILGSATVKDVIELPIEEIWTEFKDTAFIERNDFLNYFQGLDSGFALFFEDIKRFSRKIPLTELREKFGFEPPQSFLYTNHNLQTVLRNESAILAD